MAAAYDVFVGDLFYVVFSHRVSKVVSGIELRQFLRIFYLLFLLMQTNG